MILADSNNAHINGVVSYSASTRTATFIPSSSLSYNVTYTVTLTTGILDATFNPLPYTVQITFTVVDAGTMPAPEFSLMEGTYYGSQTTVVTCSESGSMISYTTDGTAPSRTNGTLVATGAVITITSPQTVRAMAYEPSYSKIDSAITSAQYIVTTAPPAFTPTGATFSSDVTVAISSATAGAVFFYTTLG
jgi:hypothetical protein